MPHSRPDASRWRRYSLGLAVAVAGALAMVFVFMPDGPGPSEEGAFDHAQWEEPGLAPTAQIPGLPGSPAIMTASLATPSGDVLVAVDPGGHVTIEPLDDGVLWTDAKAAFEKWAAGQGLDTPDYEGMQLVVDGKIVAA